VLLYDRPWPNRPAPMGSDALFPAAAILPEKTNSVRALNSPPPNNRSVCDQEYILNISLRIPTTLSFLGAGAFAACCAPLQRRSAGRIVWLLDAGK